LQIYQSSFFESESQRIPNLPSLLQIVANISKFLFWKRITTSFSLLLLKWKLLQIYQSSFFESESQLAFYHFNVNVIVANISKFLFWKRITTKFKLTKAKNALLQIYQSSFFESESQLNSNDTNHEYNCCKYIKVPFLKANHNLFCF